MTAAQDAARIGADVEALLRARDERLSGLSSDLVAAISKCADLSAGIAERDGTITTLRAEVAALTPKPPAPPAAVVRFGMAAPIPEWDARLEEVGPDLIDARRLFATMDSLPGILDVARAELAAGRLPVVSTKVPASWADMGSGRADHIINSFADQLAALDAEVFFTVHHEPVGDGIAQEFAAMTARWMPVVKARAPKVKVGPIMNGFAWSARKQGFSDDVIRQWISDDVIAGADVIGADCYHGGTAADPGEDAATKIERLSAWADRVGVKSLGIGEWNGLNADAIARTVRAVRADPRYQFALVYNSNRNNRDGVSWLLTGERLAAFRASLEESA